ncbi:MAG: hypothetical protein V5788_10615 [Shewanella sp.]
MIKIIIAILFSIPVMMVSATPSQSQGKMVWTGVVGGAFNSSNIGLTMDNGHAFENGGLSIEEDGTFKVVIKAQTMTETVQGSEIYDLVSDDSFNGDINWKLSNVYISHSGYDASKIIFQANGLDLTNESGIDTQVGEHVLLLTSNMLPNGVKNTITSKDSVLITATIIIETKI